MLLNTPSSARLKFFLDGEPEPYQGARDIQSLSDFVSSRGGKVEQEEQEEQEEEQEEEQVENGWKNGIAKTMTYSTSLLELKRYCFDSKHMTCSSGNNGCDMG